MNQIIKMQFNLFSLALIFAASSGSAWALTASNTQIINNATLSYNDGTGTTTIPASVTVTVALLPAAPAVAPGPPQTTPYVGPGTLLTNSFTVTASANGPDTYSVASAITGSTNTSGATPTPRAPATVSLGATVTLTGSTDTTIVVPSDGSSNASVNGILAGSSVVIGSELPHTVQSVTDNASGTSTITLTTALTAAPGAGVLVAEQKTVLVDVTAGTITTTGTSITVTKNITVTSTTSPNPAVTSGTVTDTYTSGAATLAKYVRVVKASPPAGTGSPYAYNSNNYYQAGISAAPGETLEYILVATNSGSGPVTAAMVSDVLPTSYVTLVPNAYGANREVTYVSDTGVTSTYSAASDTDQATYATGTLTVYVGTGATNSAGGSIPGSNSHVLVLYQTTVNP
jgi:hypothetical protein